VSFVVGCGGSLPVCVWNGFRQYLRGLTFDARGKPERISELRCLEMSRPIVFKHPPSLMVSGSDMDLVFRNAFDEILHSSVMSRGPAPFRTKSLVIPIS
jgi:hypothetical protein